MPRTDTTSQSSFRRSDVTYDIPTPSSTSTSGKLRFHIPPNSDWSSGLHWHETHTEFLQVIQGRAEVTIGTVTKVYTPKDGILKIERGVVHEVKRAPVQYLDPEKEAEKGGRELWGGLGAEVEEEEVLTIQEWTDPADGEKEIFFRNLNSAVLDGEKTLPTTLIPLEWWVQWQVLVIAARWDNYPVIFSAGNDGTSRMVTSIVLKVLAMVGLIFGLKAIYPEYTPSTNKKKV